MESVDNAAGGEGAMQLVRQKGRRGGWVRASGMRYWALGPADSTAGIGEECGVLNGSNEIVIGRPIATSSPVRSSMSLASMFGRVSRLIRAVCKTPLSPSRKELAGVMDDDDLS